MTESISQALRANWQVPAYENQMWLGKKHDYCVVIPVINEGDRIRNLLARMAAINVSTYADIIIVDGGSTDGSLELNDLQEVGVSGLILKKAPVDSICQCNTPFNYLFRCFELQCLSRSVV
ncbi:glycosyltransferase [Citrobacter freundii]|uniref:glycosyltransferase n=1 Tax=Citrobacter freundii TaxID=546 RepID=UPI003C6EC5D5